MQQATNILNDVDDTLIAKAKRIKLAIFDVDGVFTDGSLYIGNNGEEYKRFNVHDGLGIVLLLKSNIEVAIISGLHSAAVRQRMQALGVKHIFLGQDHKVSIYKKLLKQLNLNPEEVAYIGDDLQDLALLQCVGLPVTVANAREAVRRMIHWQTQASGGYGAVREFCDWLLQAQEKLEGIVAQYSGA